MKQVLFIVIFLYCNGVAKGQKQQTFYFINDASVTTNDYFFINPGVYQTIGKCGLFCEAVFEKDVWSVAPGIFFTIQPKNKLTYHEIGAGIGFEKGYTQNISPTKYLNTYYYFEIFSPKNLEENKMMVAVNISYADTWGLWRMGSIVYYPTKKIGVGFKTQSYAVDGLHMQYRISKKLTPSVTIGLNGRVQFGITSSFQKTF